MADTFAAFHMEINVCKCTQERSNFHTREDNHHLSIFQNICWAQEDIGNFILNTRWVTFILIWTNAVIFLVQSRNDSQRSSGVWSFHQISECGSHWELPNPSGLVNAPQIIKTLIWDNLYVQYYVESLCGKQSCMMPWINKKVISNQSKEIF